MADVECGRQLAGQRVVTKQRHTIAVEGMAVTGQLAAREHHGTVRVDRQKFVRRRILNQLQNDVALGIEFGGHVVLQLYRSPAC